MMQTPTLFPTTCSIALKEWHATCGALAQGRQIMLLRKGGIHDAGGVFELEHTAFWLLPTWLHQNANLVKPAHRDLLTTAPRDRQTFTLQWWARVEGVWALNEADQSTLMTARHIWSDDYLEIRFGYKPEHPLLCVALRVYETAAPHILKADPKGFGCRTWIELDSELPMEAPTPAVDDLTFEAYRNELRARFETMPTGAMR